MTITETITWIPVEEKLPVKWEVVLIKSDKVDAGALTKDGWVDRADWMLKHVTHWAPMPKGPK